LILFFAATYLEDIKLVDCWHRDKLNKKDATLLEVGKNAISLIKSFPENTTERTALIKSTSNRTTIETEFLLSSSRNSQRSIWRRDWFISAVDLQSEKKWRYVLPLETFALLIFRRFAINENA
jgi:hypothetical protein